VEYAYPIKSTAIIQKSIRMVTRRIAKLATALLFALTLALSFAPAANAQSANTDPSPIQIPITVVAPIQTCNNNVAAGVIGVPVDALTPLDCIQD
jgi:hypothetical protein